MTLSLLPIIIFLATLIIIANLTDRYGSPRARRVFFYGLVLLNFPILAYGLLLAGDIFGQTGVMAEDELVRSSGLATIYMAAAGLLLILPPIRRFLDRRTPLNASSAVHTTALLLTGYLVGQALGTQLHGGLEGLQDADITTSLLDIVVQQSLFLIIGILGVGIFIRRNGADTARRLGLTVPTLRQIRYGLLWIGPLVILQGLIGAVWVAFNPEQAELLEQVSQTLLADVDTVGEWFVVGLAPGVSEEILFRGAVQPVFGIWATAGLFAIAHTQYALSPATLVVLIVGLVLGYIREKESTTVAILVHFGYNFTLGLLSLLASMAT